MNSDLILLVTNPNQSFVKTEIESFALLVERLFVVSISHKKPDYELPPNVVYHYINLSEYKEKNIEASDLSILFLDGIQHITNISYIKQTRKHLSMLRQARFLKTQLIEFMKRESVQFSTPILSFWGDIWSLSLTILKQENSSYKVATRLHGRDLYEERQPTTTFAIPFRPFVVKTLDKLFPVSAHGANYLIKKYPKYKAKVIFNYLGCNDFVFSTDVTQTFTILSIAKIRHVKRIHRIAEVVKEFPLPIKWVHIGGEANRKNDATIAYTEAIINEINLLPDKQVITVGEVDSKGIIEVVREHLPHFLINTSEYEGLPVSVMEALSMGIPSVATDVGGTNELVDEKFLLNKEFKNEELIALLVKIQEEDLAKLKKKAREKWSEQLNVIRNRKKLLNEL